MKLLSLALSTTLALAAHSASAVNSEILRLTPTGFMEMTPAILFSAEKGNQPEEFIQQYPGYESYTRSNLTEKLMFEFGLNDQHSAGGEVSLSEYKTVYAPADQSSVQKGMNDFRLFIKNITPMGEGVFHYGADLMLSIAPRQYNNAGDSNTSTGGHTIAPYIGFEADSALGGAIGFRLSRSFLLTNKVSDNTDDATKNASGVGGEVTTLTVFNEWDYNELVKFGVAASAVGVGNDVWTQDNGTMITTGGSTQGILKLYVPMKFEFATLLPAFTFTRVTAMDNSQYDSQSAWELSFAGRFTF